MKIRALISCLFIVVASLGRGEEEKPHRSLNEVSIVVNRSVSLALSPEERHVWATKTKPIRSSRTHFMTEDEVLKENKRWIKLAHEFFSDVEHSRLKQATAQYFFEVGRPDLAFDWAPNQDHG